MPNFAFRDSVSLRLRNLTVLPKQYSASVHGSLLCRDCHPDVRRYPHSFDSGIRRPVSCGDECHARDRQGKSYSHATIFADFRSSVHGKSLADPRSDAPSCSTCHGGGNPHEVHRAAKAMTAGEKMNLCVACHDDRAKMAKNHLTTEPVESYRRSFHFKAIRFGATGTAVCQDCHTVHHVLPPDSAGSSVSPALVAATCGQTKCHPGAKMNFAMSGANHLSMRIEKVPLLWVEEKFFLFLTGGTILMLIAGIILDVQKKFGWLKMTLRVLRAIRKKAVSTRPLISRTGYYLKRILID